VVSSFDLMALRFTITTTVVDCDQAKTYSREEQIHSRGDVVIGGETIPVPAGTPPNWNPHAARSKRGLLIGTMIIL
jgi:hypothetical protein